QADDGVGVRRVGRCGRAGGRRLGQHWVVPPSSRSRPGTRRGRWGRTHRPGGSALPRQARRSAAPAGLSTRAPRSGIVAAPRHGNSSPRARRSSPVPAAAALRAGGERRGWDEMGQRDGGADAVLRRTREVFDWQKRWGSDVMRRPVVPPLLDLRRWAQTVVDNASASMRALETMAVSNAERALRAGRDPTVEILQAHYLTTSDLTKDRLAWHLVRLHWPEEAKRQHENARH